MSGRASRRRWTWVPATLFLMLGTSGVLRAAESDEIRRWISASDLIAYAEIPSPEALIDQIRSDRVRELLRAVPGLGESIRSNPKLREFRQVVRYLADELETQPVDGLRTLLGGGVVLAVEGAEKPERIYLIVTPKDVEFLEEAHSKLVELARRDAEEHGRPDPVKEADYRDIHGYSVADQEAHAIIEGSLVIANGGDPIKTLIDRIRDGGASSPLCEDPNWMARREANGADASAWSFVDLAKVRKMDPERYAPEQVDPGAIFVFGPWIEAARQADWATLSMTWNSKRLAAELAMANPGGGYSPAMRGYLPPEGRGASKPIEVPGVIASGTLWRDLAAIWEARGEIFPPEAQQGFAQLDSFAGQFFGGRDFGSGVLGSLGSQWRVIVARQDPADLDPKPEVILPAFAIVLDVAPDDDDFVQRLRAAFQSFIGLANLGAAQTKAPPLMLGSEEFQGVTITTSRFLPPKNRNEDEPIHQRHNFSPSAVQAGDHFIISSSLGLARKLVTALTEGHQGEAESTDATLVLTAEGASLGELIDQNRERLVLQNMVKEGNERERAESEVDLLKALVEYLGTGTLTASDTPEGLRIRLGFDLSD